MYDISAIYEASSVENAVKLRQEHPDAVIIAGGSDVLIKIREGKLSGAELISIYGLSDLRGVTMGEDGTIRIGSLTSFSHITKDPLIREHIGVLGEAVDLVGGPQIRAIGTIGGNTCNGVTSADSASTLFAWDAVVELTGPEGVRNVPIEEFYLSAGKVDIREGEIQTAILIPKESWEGYKGHYIKYGMRRAMEIATLGCSVNVRLSEDKKTLTSLRIGFGVAGPVPRRARSTEQAFTNVPLTEDLPKEIGRAVLADVNPRDSWRAPKDMRLHLCSVMAERAFIEAARLSGTDLYGKAEGRGSSFMCGSREGQGDTEAGHQTSEAAEHQTDSRENSGTGSTPAACEAGGEAR